MASPLACSEALCNGLAKIASSHRDDSRLYAPLQSGPTPLEAALNYMENSYGW